MPAARPSLAKLDFKEKLIQSGKKENTDALLKRIKTLHLKLRELEQDVTDTKSLDAYKSPLINPIIMHHKDRGVKAYAACCLADMLRLYAPDAPYSPEELRDIFQFISTQIITNLKVASSSIKPLQPSRGRTNTENAAAAGSQRITDVPYFAEYSYLLENLATIRSVILVTDVPDGEEIMTSFFEGFIQILRSDMSQRMIKHMRDILVALIDETSAIPSGVMDCIIGQFQDAKETTQTLPFLLIQDVCNKTAQKLTRMIYTHFSAIQLEHGRSKEASSSDIETLKESHELMVTIYRHCPALMVGFIAQLEENLRAADEIPLRELSTRTLGTMFGLRPVVGTNIADLAKAYPAAWRAWLGRKVDKALPVRLAWVASARGILVEQPDLRAEMESELADRIQDSDERVRAAICKVLGSVDYDTALHHLSADTMRAVGGRVSDKKASVRAEATQSLAKLWNSAYASIEQGEAEAINQFAWIPNTLLTAMVRKDATTELRSQLVSVLKHSILPLPAADQIDEQAWVDRLLVVYAHLNEAGAKALVWLTGLKGFSRGNSPYRAFIAFCEENNAGDVDGDAKLVRARLDFVINAIARMLFPDHNKARKDLETFAMLNEARLYKLLKGCVDPQSDLRTIVKSQNELLRRIQQTKSEILETFTVLIDNASWNILNHSSIPPLIKRMQRPSGITSADAASSLSTADRAESDGPISASRAAYELLGMIAKECSPMFKSHVPELVLVMADKKNELLSEAALRGLACVTKAEPDCAPDDKRSAEKAYNKAMEGTPRQAKFATRFLAYSEHKELCKDLLNDVLARLENEEDDHRLAHLRVLSEMALSAPQVLEERATGVLRTINEDILAKESPTSEEDVDAGWVPEHELDTLDRAKLLALRILTHRTLAHARTDDATTLVQDTFGVLRDILEARSGDDEDESQETTETRASHHLKLRAGLCMLKLANAKVFDKCISWDLFETVASICQAAVFHVRHTFLLKLGEILPTQRLMPRWNVVPVMAASDPDNENLLLAASILKQVVNGAATLPTEQRIDRIELQLARLLLVLSHHPDLEHSQRMFKTFAMYIELYIDSFATRDNISLILHVAAKVKTVKDAMRDDSDDLYRLSELAQQIIKNRAEKLGWPLSTYPGKIRLPKEGFHNLHNPEEAKRVFRTTYLDEGMIGWAKGLGKRGPVTGPARKAVSAAQRTRSSESPKKRASGGKGKKGPAKKKRRQDDDDEDDDEEESEEEDEEDEEDENDEEEEEEDGEDGVMGRGGRRGAKTKAKKAVNKSKSKQAKAKARSKRKSEDVEMEEEESELTEED